MRHTEKYYEKLISSLNLSLSDMIKYLHNYCGVALKRDEVIPYLVKCYYSTKEIRNLTNIF